MADNRTISQLEAEGYPWIGCECCKGTVWVPFRMLRERMLMLDLVAVTSVKGSPATAGATSSGEGAGTAPGKYKTISTVVEELDAAMITTCRYSRALC